MFNRIFDHYPMLADQVRLDCYKRAILKTVKKGDVVCDIGTGSGILAFFSVMAGASKVYAIEQTSIVEETKRIAAQNGWDQKIIFIKQKSDKVELPEKVDVVTSELIGYFGLEENLHQFKLDARRRFLKPHGKLIPQWLKLYLLPVQSAEIWNNRVAMWSQDYYGIDFSSVQDTATSQRFLIDCSANIRSLSKPVNIGTLDFYNEEMPSTFEGCFKIVSNGIFHGFVGYFKCGLMDKIILSTSPEDPVTHWKQVFFPSKEKIKVIKGDTLHCKMKAIPCGNEVFWEWKTSIYRNKTKMADFIQSNLWSLCR